MILKIKDTFFLYSLLFIITLEGMYLPLLFSITGMAMLVKLLLYAKYILAVLYFVLFFKKGFFKRLRILQLDLLIVIYITYIVFVIFFGYVMGSTLPLSEALIFFFPFILFIAGRSVTISDKDFRKYLRVLIIFSGFIFVYSIIDILILPSSIWRDFLRQGDYLIEVKNFRRGIVDGLIGNFYFNPWSATRFRRAVGFMGDPLAFAYSSSFFFLIILYLGRIVFNKKYKYRIILIAGIIAILFSFTRAVIISMSLVLLVNYFAKNKTIYVTTIVGVISLGLLSFSGGLLAQIVGLNDGSTFGHLDSLGSIQKFTMEDVLLGHAIINPDYFIRFESGLLGVLINFGIFGLLLFVTSIISILTKLYNNKGDIFSIVVALTGLIGFFTTIVFSESFLTFTGFGVFWFNAGLAISRVRK